MESRFVVVESRFGERSHSPTVCSFTPAPQTRIAVDGEVGDGEGVHDAGVEGGHPDAVGVAVGNPPRAALRPGGGEGVWQGPTCKKTACSDPPPRRNTTLMGRPGQGQGLGGSRGAGWRRRSTAGSSSGRRGPTSRTAGGTPPRWPAPGRGRGGQNMDSVGFAVAQPRQSSELGEARSQAWGWSSTSPGPCRPGPAGTAVAS